MKQGFIIIVLIGLFFPIQGQNPPQDKNWDTVFQDAFNTFNSGLWYRTYGAHEAGTTREGTSFRTYDNVYIENGKLVLQVQDTISPPCLPQNGVCKYGGNHAYTSGAIMSNIRYGYGYLEIYAQLPASSGYFPAFWLWYGENNEVTNNCWANEIDIFEAKGSKPTIVTCNVWYQFKCNSAYKQWGAEPNPCNYSTGYHWYGMEWDSKKITWYIDRQMVRQEPNNMDDVGIQNPMQIIINTELAGDWMTDNPIDSTTIFPNYMYVDQANVYKLKYECDAIVNEILNYNTFNYAVKKSISLSSVSSLFSGENVSLRATDFIELESGFEVPEGAELYLDINPCE